MSHHRLASATSLSFVARSIVHSNRVANIKCGINDDKTKLNKPQLCVCVWWEPVMPMPSSRSFNACASVHCVNRQDSHKTHTCLVPWQQHPPPTRMRNTGTEISTKIHVVCVCLCTIISVVLPATSGTLYCVAVGCVTQCLSTTKFYYDILACPCPCVLSFIINLNKNHLKMQNILLPRNL